MGINQPTPNSNRDAHVIMQNMNDTLSKLPWAWRKVLRTQGLDTISEIGQLGSVCQHGQTENVCVFERDVVRMRKDLKGACISKLDRNAGKLHICCPKVYSDATNKVFDIDNSDAYEILQPKRFDEFQKGGKSI